MVKAVSLQSLMTVIERHKLEPVNGQYNITKEMFAEAAAIDVVAGVPQPSPEKLKVILESRDGWEEGSEEDIAKPIDDKEKMRIREVTWQIGMLLRDNKVPYDIAVSAMCMAMKHIASYGWGLDEAETNAKLAKLFTRQQ